MQVLNVDVLSDVLEVVRLTGTVFFTADLGAPWSVISPPTDILLRGMPTRAECVTLFHIIAEGNCLFKTETGIQFSLGKGSVIIFPHGRSHIMCSNMNVNPVNLMQLLSFEMFKRPLNLKHGGSGARTQFICGYLMCNQRFNPLLGALPDVLILSPQGEEITYSKTGNESILMPNTIQIITDSWLDITLKHLVSEVVEKKSGGDTMITRLTELMYVEVLRKYMNNLPLKSDGWLAGIRDPEVGRALKYLHAQPEEKWSVEQLASKVGVSRSAFAQRFTDLIGESPIKYLTSWRMQLAKKLLLQPNLSLAMVAEKVGYDSDIAFNRAFKRYVGEPPARWREQIAKFS